MIASPPVLSQTGVLQVFNQLSARSSHAILLDGGGDSPALNRFAFMGMNPCNILQLKGNRLFHNAREIPLKTSSELFDFLRHQFEQANTWTDVPHLPFTGGWMGYFGYEFYRWCEPALANLSPPIASPYPDMLLCEFQDWLVLDKATGSYYPLSHDAEFKSQAKESWHQAQAMEHRLHTANPDTNFKTTLEPNWNDYARSISQPDFESAVATICDHIQRGDLYQANLSFQFQKRLFLPPANLYQRLCQRNPSPFSGIIRWPEGMILCNSPERLVQMDAHGMIQSRPIAGTRGRGQTAAEDEIIGESLLNDEKERAEHLMLVDLHRNDLGRVCLPGSVEVDELLVLERYSHVTHLVSNVKGQCNPQKDAFDILQALFPGGTITGCPKIRCIQTLNEMEPVARGPYTGSMGYFDRATGGLDLNILIRSIFLSPEPGSQVSPALDEGFMYNTAIHAGAGIVADSVGAHEYRECLRKASAIVGVLSHYDFIPHQF